MDQSAEIKLITGQLERWIEQGLQRVEPAGARPIRELHLELTHRCNLKCVMCHHWEMPFEDPASVKREMGLEEIRELACSPSLREVKHVVISGGEPMLRADFNAIITTVALALPYAEITVLANFWNTELVRRRLSALRQKGVRKLSLGSSLDGLGATHDKIRGQAGAFDGLVRTAELIRREFPDVAFSFSFTATPRNYRALWPTYQFVTDKLRTGFSAQLVVDHQGYEAPESFEWEPEELRAVAAQIDSIIADIARREDALGRIVRGEERESQWLWERLLFWVHLKRYALKPERFFKNCMAGERFAMFDPEGNLFYCPVNKHRRIGNIREQPLELLWKSEKAQSERNYVASCQCDCWLNCIANPILERVTSAALSPRPTRTPEPVKTA